jgi:hypothetical protein
MCNAAVEVFEAAVEVLRLLLRCQGRLRGTRPLLRCQGQHFRLDESHDAGR